MQTRLKSDVVIENRGGAGGVIANEQVARAPADGKTLLFATLGSHVISAALRAAAYLRSGEIVHADRLRRRRRRA